MAEPAAKKLKGAGSFHWAYKEGWADSYPVGLVNGNKGTFYFILFKKKCKLYTTRTWRHQTTLCWKNTQKNAAAIAQRRKITFTKPVNDDKQIRAEVFTHKFYSSAQYFFPNC